ncbi:MAG: SDR family NAD(P)-dependent oxidoreductase [Hyphomicrobiaceae bacterium]|nr:SDR family NAD(P)-dependent oxidoreductase [Hyphomicrobiaceae bacterium]
MSYSDTWRTVWVTGASSGLGRELALQLARDGCQVAVSARSADALAELARATPGIHVFPLDVTDLAATRATARAIQERLGPLDLAILNAGVWRPLTVRTFSAEAVTEGMTVNYLGVTNALDPLLSQMLAVGKGQLALISSVSGYRGLPRAAAYAPTKAALINLAETLRLELHGSGVEVSIVNPGFIRTPMTDVNTFPMPFIMDVDEAARKILHGLRRRRYEIAFPWPLVGFLKFARLLPNALFLPLMRRLTLRKSAV